VVDISIHDKILVGNFDPLETYTSPLYMSLNLFRHDYMWHFLQFKSKRYKKTQKYTARYVPEITSYLNWQDNDSVKKYSAIIFS